MKKTILGTLLAVGFAASVLAQGSVYFDTSNNTSASPTATSNGQWWIQSGGSTTLLNADVNATLFGSATGAAGTFTPLVTLLASGTGSGDITFYGLGQFSDQTGKAYAVAGATTSAYFYIQAWLGSATSFGAAGAVAKYDGSVNGIFQNAVAVSPTPAPYLTSNPAIVLTVPEPGTFALAGLGAAALLIFRRRK